MIDPLNFFLFYVIYFFPVTFVYPTCLQRLSMYELHQVNVGVQISYMMKECCHITFNEWNGSGSCHKILQKKLSPHWWEHHISFLYLEIHCSFILEFEKIYVRFCYLKTCLRFCFYNQFHHNHLDSRVWFSVCIL